MLYACTNWFPCFQTTVQVIQLWSDEVEADDVGPGENVRMKLKGIEDTDVLPGFILCAPDSPCKVGRIFDAEVTGFQNSSLTTDSIELCTFHKQESVFLRCRF